MTGGGSSVFRGRHLGSTYSRSRDIESLDAAAIPRIRMPERARVFAPRAARLRQLAARGNPIAGYLRLMAALADAQQAVLERFGAAAEPPS